MGAKRIILANKDLEKFLRREGVLRKFIENCKNNSENYKAHLNYSEIRITEVFVFDETPEGFHFWQNLHDKFELQQSKIIN